jgi:hypothetical protein
MKASNRLLAAFGLFLLLSVTAFVLLLRSHC